MRPARPAAGMTWGPADPVHARAAAHCPGCPASPRSDSARWDRNAAGSAPTGCTARRHRRTRSPRRRRWSHCGSSQPS
ncbi:hypothetical protein G6F22_021193 [Rhizopus arrhizus]|nr:hypothetical protein G6F22_021193 [Rhizopus arrhizus]